MNLLSVENLGKNLGERILFEGLTFGLSKGEKVALIANNGTGKSSLLKIISGIDVPDEGKVVFRNKCRVSFLQQDAVFDNNQTITELLSSTYNKISCLINEYNVAVKRHSNENSQQSRKNLEIISAKMEQENAWDYERKSKQILSLNFFFADLTNFLIIIFINKICEFQTNSSTE